MLIEDPTLKEDQARQKRCEDYFLDLTSKGHFDNDTDLAVITEFLHDTWSVIRYKCGSLLNQVKLSDQALHKIIKDLCDAVSNDASQWQIVHGSIIGLNALIQYAVDSSIQQQVCALCLSNIGHIRTPIREDARKCLVSIQKISRNKRVLLGRIIQMINSLLVCKSTEENHLPIEHSTSNQSVGESIVVEGTEEEVLTLDGLLGCLSDNYHHFPELLQLEDAIQKTTMNGEFTSLQVVDTMKMCMEHGASSIRQKGGQVLSIILMSFLKFAKTSDSSDDAALNSPFGTVKPLASASAEFVDYILSNVLIPAIESDEYHSWSIQEISLMISEELIKEIISIQQQLADLSATVRSEAFSTTFTASSDIVERNSAAQELNKEDDEGFTTATASRSSFQRKISLENVSDELAVHAKFGTIRQMTKLLHVLKNRIPILLCHEKFEVRRMALQLMPYLARTLVLVDLNHRHVIDFSLSTSDSSEVETAERDRDSFTQRDSTSTNDSAEVEKDLYATPMKNRNLPNNTQNTDDGNASRTTNRRISRAVTHSGTGAVLDLMLMAQMAWIGEVIKENQHIFEAFPIDDYWESHAAVKLIHMRSMSRDNQMLQALEQMSVASFSSSRNLASASMQAIDENEPCLQSASIMNNSKSFDNDLSLVGREIEVDDELDEVEDSEDKQDLNVPRGVVDNWSLDGRGRLMELENRSVFHKFVKGVVLRGSWKANTRIVTILASNCKLLMKNIEVIMNKLERLLFKEVLQQQNTIPLPTVFASSPSVESSFSTDFVEVFALIKSFLLSVKYRFIHAAQLKPYIPLMRQNMLKASSLLIRLDMFMIAWIRRVVQVQANACFTNDSAHMQNKGTVAGISHDRWGSAALLHICMKRGTLRDGQNKGSTEDLARSMLAITRRYHENMKLADSKQNGTICDPYQEHVSVPPPSSIATNQPPPPPPQLVISTQESVMESSPELANLVIIPSLTEAGTNPAIYLESTALHDYMKSAVASRKSSVSNTPQSSRMYQKKYSFNLNAAVPVGASASVASVLNSSWPRDGNNRIIVPVLGGSSFPSECNTAANSATNSVVNSPTKISTFAQNIVNQYHHLSSHQVPDEMAHGKSPGIRYHSMDRWNCEAVAPTLYCIANSLHDEKEALCLASITIEWILSALLNPLWLDNRIGAKKNLYDALVVLLSSDDHKLIEEENGRNIVKDLSIEEHVARQSEALVQLHADSKSITKMNPPGASDIYMLLLSVRIVRAIAEALSLRSSNGLTPRGGYGEKLLLDLKCLLCLVRSAVKGIATSVRYYVALNQYFQRLALNEKQQSKDDKQRIVLQQLLTAWTDIRNSEIMMLFRQCNGLFLDAIRYYKGKFPAVENMQEISDAIDITARNLTVRSRSGSSVGWGLPMPVGVGLLPAGDMVAAADYVTGVSTTTSPNKASDVGSVAGPAGAEVEEDEFSDWDEESDEEEGIPSHTDSTANMHQTYLTARLWEDMQQLEVQLRIWEMYLNKNIDPMGRN